MGPLFEPRPHDVAGLLDCPPTLPAVIRRGAQRFGDLNFLRGPDGSLSYAETDAASSRLARALLAAGVGKGTRVGIMMPNGANWVIAWFAVSRIGAVAVALSTLFQRREVDWALRHNDIDTLLVAAQSGIADYQILLQEALPALASFDGQHPLILPSHPYLRRVVVWGGVPSPWAISADRFLAAIECRPEFSDALVSAVEGNVAPADDLIVICTSGTTAEPKAVISTHGAAIRSTWAFHSYFGYQRGERTYGGMPFFWVGGILCGIMPAFYVGASLSFPRTLSGDDLLDMLIEQEITALYMIPGQLHAAQSAAKLRGIDISGVRPALRPWRHGSLAVPSREDFPGGSLGMTETFGTHSSEAQDRPAQPGKAGNWGRGLPGAERRIVAPATGEPLPAGREGELQVRGLNLMRGYVKVERHEVLTSDGWFPTGDKAMIDEDGFLYFYGRASEMIKTSGANVAPREVEAMLMAFPEIREAIVFGLPDPSRGEIVAAAIVPEEGFNVDINALRLKALTEISSYKVPKVIVPMAHDAIPRTQGSAKPRKGELRTMVREMLSRDAAQQF